MLKYPRPTLTADQYLQMFRMTRVWSQDLKKKSVRDAYLEAGFLYVRPVIRSYNQSLRNPTVGRLLELYVTQQCDCVPIISRRGHDLIHRLCSVG